MMEAGTFIKNEPDKGYHPDATGGWDYYDFTYQVGNRFFRGETQIKKAKNEAIFNDITK